MRKLRFLFASFLLTTVVLGSTSAAHAVSNSLGVNPRRDFTIKAGEKISDTVTVSNLNKTEPLDVNINLIDFGPRNETGSPALLLGQKEPTRWSLKPYLTIAKDLHVPAGKSVDVPYTIAIPAKTGAGSFYGAIKYTAGGTEGSQNLSLSGSSATLVFVRVPGETKEGLILKKFGAFTPTVDGTSGSFGRLYVGEAPKYVAYRTQNTGNVAEEPVGSVRVKNIFGRQVKIFESANPNKSIVLIDQTRRFDLCFNEEKLNRTDQTTGRNIEELKCNASKLSPGRYTAQLSLLYGDQGTGANSQHQLLATTSFWYLPMWFMLVVVVVLLAIAGIIWLIIKAYRGSHRQFSRRGSRR